MKGIIFTEFIEMVENRFTPEMADRIIESADLPSRGAYAATGTYDHDELVSLVANLSAETGKAVSDLLTGFGEHLFGHLAEGHPKLFEGIESAFDFIERVEGHVHVQVKKIYPDATVPSFECYDRDDDHLTMIYRSPRPFADFAKGMMKGCAAHFSEEIDIEQESMTDAVGSAVRFTLTRRN